jgi:multidrug transporter EmrE-like cation transporter
VTGGTLALILVSVSLSALAQISFKLGVTGAAGHPVVVGGMAGGLINSMLTPGVIVGLALYGFGTLLWLTALARVDVSQAYPFVGLGFVLTAILGYAFFGDALTPQRIVGIFVVMGGVWLVAQS